MKDRQTKYKNKLVYVIVCLMIVSVLIILKFLISALSAQTNQSSTKNYHIDLSQQTIGQLKRYETNSSYIFVYRRSAEEVEWLRTRTPPKYNKNIVLSPLHKNGSSYENPYRSENPEYFVFFPYGFHNNMLYLRGGFLSSYRCGTLRVNRQRQNVNNQLFLGSFMCSETHENPQEPLQLYDLAGLSSNPNFAPLDIPRYYFKSQNTIVVSSRYWE